MTESELLIYQDENDKVKVDVRLENETVWLTQEHRLRSKGGKKSNRRFKLFKP